MREIKFRAWDNSHKCHHYSENCTLDWLFELPGRHGGVIEQYTGLKDKNGREIYEGDIVLANGKMGAVVWAGYQFRIPGFYAGWQDDPTDAFSENAELEIIGNIHENPELLK